MEIKGPISLGELIDKITILEIKTEKINETEKLKNISNELGRLFILLDSLQLNKKDFDKYSKQLYEVNKKLWETEDILRALENKKSFNKDFIENARNVYKLNDERFRIKNKLNKQFSSEIIEEKSYKDYK